MPRLASISLLVVPACLLLGCDPEALDQAQEDAAYEPGIADEDGEDNPEEIPDIADIPLLNALSHAQLVARANAIKAVHADDPLVNNPVIFAGIASAETGMAHCYDEYTGVKCMGYYSSSACGGGRILAGGHDGTCDQGGLGMFQFDNGSQSQTRNHWLYTGMWPTGNRRKHDVADLGGNIRASIDFVLFKAWYSSYTPYFPSQQSMYDWVNSIRPIPGDPDFEHWLGFLAYNYNGQPLYSQGWYNVKTKYRNATVSIYNNLGGFDFWYADEPEPCAPQGGLWCGGNGVEGDPNTLYVCSGGYLTVDEHCSYGCHYAAPGWSDYCY